MVARPAHTTARCLRHRPTTSSAVANGGPERSSSTPSVFVVSGAVVLVVPADPQLEPIVLVAAFRRPVEDRVVAHEELDPTPPGRIALVDGPVLQDEGAEAGALSQVPGDVSAA